MGVNSVNTEKYIIFTLTYLEMGALNEKGKREIFLMDNGICKVVHKARYKVSFSTETLAKSEWNLAVLNMWSV